MSGIELKVCLFSERGICIRKKGFHNLVESAERLAGEKLNNKETATFIRQGTEETGDLKQDLDSLIGSSCANCPLRRL